MKTAGDEGNKRGSGVRCGEGRDKGASCAVGVTQEGKELRKLRKMAWIEGWDSVVELRLLWRLLYSLRVRGKHRRENGFNLESKAQSGLCCVQRDPIHALPTQKLRN
ncbi:hypothetical protein RJT34_14232 [Clitoria ternatea]|uniref:Uncharacterized protein n=1 Tax=Clitoria ternatea TaxID=43366 RepID=A0AAN9JS77_CLITE